jgi:hypothetical protein
VVASGVMPMEAYQTGEEFMVHFDLPGVHPSAIELNVQHNMLTGPPEAESVATNRPKPWWPSVRVPETPHMSRDLLIFVEQSAEAVAPSDTFRVARSQLGERPEGRGLAERAVWPVAAVVLGIRRQHGSPSPDSSIRA